MNEFAWKYECLARFLAYVIGKSVGCLELLPGKKKWIEERNHDGGRGEKENDKEKRKNRNPEKERKLGKRNKEKKHKWKKKHELRK